MKYLHKVILIVAVQLMLIACDNQADKKAGKQPNFIIFFTDDLGYNDIEPFGAPRIKTPHLNKMAAAKFSIIPFTFAWHNKSIYKLLHTTFFM